MSTPNWDIGEILNSHTDADLDNLTKEDFKSMVEALKYTTSNIAAMEHKMVVLRNDNKEMKEMNHELVTMNVTLREILKKDDEESRKLKAMVRQYQRDQVLKFVRFDLNDVILYLTRDQMRQIVTWYEPGKVYFAPDEANGIKYHFCEVVKYVDHKDENNMIDALVTYEDDTVVSILTMDMIIEQRHLTPMHVLKFLVKPRERRHNILTKEQVGEFLMSINYVGEQEDSAF